MSKVALVTGGAVRIGRAISLGLAEAGYDVVVNYHSSQAEAASVSRQIREAGRHCIATRGDVSRAGEVEALAQEVRTEFGRLDLLVNNASIFPQKALLDVEEAEWDRVMEVNLKGPFLMVKATADLLTAARGCVINLVDLSAFQPWVDYPHHAVSKAGLLHLTRVMARAMAPRVRVNAIAPGSVLPPDDYDQEDNERSRSRAALGSLGSPEDVVRTVLFLDRSPFITGEVIVVDGGRLLG
ncbi:MAG: SDR family oxidoreductase [Gemmatimonadales bacterium]|nr:MAG: SDR family oxidoreductase [Gemmatimonadales bacterium]